MTLSVLVTLLALGVLLPAAVCGVLYLVLRRPLSDAAAPVALTAGFLAGYFGLNPGAFTFPPQTVQQWLPVVAIGALVLGLLEPRYLRSPLSRWAVRLVLLELLLWQLFQPFINHPFESRRWSTGETFSHLALCTLLIGIFWYALDTLTKRELKPARAQAILPTALVLIGSAVSIGLVLAKSVVMGQLAGALTAALGALAFLCWWVAGWRLPPSATPLIVLVFALPWLGVYTTLKPWVVTFIALSPFMLLIPTGGSLWRQPLRLLLLVMPLAAALALAF